MVIVKNESPKPSPEERLARKRAAARLRQQRCRERKRQAMLEKKRCEVGVDIRQRCVKIPTHDPTRSHANAVIHVPHPSPHHCSQSTRFPPSYNLHSMTASEPVGAESWVGGYQQSQKLSSEQRSIYNCVSFDSQKSFEDARSRLQQPPPSSPPCSFSSKAEPNSSIQVVTPSRTPPPTGNQEQQTSTISTPASILVKVLSDEKLEEPLVSEEEAAVVAMLSLKSALKLDSKDLATTKCDADVADECNDTTTTDSELTTSSLASKIAFSQHESSSSNNYPSSDISVVLHSKQQLHQFQYQHEHLRHEQHIMQLQSQQRQHKNNPRGLYETTYHTHNNYGPPPSLQQISPTRRTTQPIPGGYYRINSRPPMPTHHLHPQHNPYSRGVGAGGYYSPASRYARGL